MTSCVSTAESFAIFQRLLPLAMNCSQEFCTYASLSFTVRSLLDSDNLRTAFRSSESLQIFLDTPTVREHTWFSSVSVDNEFRSRGHVALASILSVCVIEFYCSVAVYFCQSADRISAIRISKKRIFFVLFSLRRGSMSMEFYSLRPKMRCMF